MKKYFKIFLWVLLAVAVIGTFMFLWQKSKAKPKEYQIETVTKQDTIESKTVITGTVEPRDEVLIKPQMNGIVAELLHEAGDVVQSGDVIARLTVVPEMIQLSQAESRVRMAEISYEQGKESYARSKDLFDKSVIALEEFEAAEANFAKIKEELSNAREAMEIVKKGASSRTAKQSNTLVRSTITGKILNVPVKVGNSVIQANTFNEGTTIASIADMNDLIFVGKIDETEVGRIRLGSPMRISVGALGKESFPATVEYLAPKGSIVNGAVLFEVKASVHIPSDRVIRAGYSANAEIVLEGAYGVPAVPEACIEFSGDSTFVQVVKAEKPLQTERRQVKTGVSNGSNIEIKSGLKVGEKVRGIEKTEEKK
ncbi:efflux RND transporter periplasmic adaptor subunit [Porphyromonas gingivalis]|uniref:Efflux RND transporter periplasmic adaptor subunit n=1 Tax=Porphyromonas gingivalis TaxID=837 RepID=A0AAE9X7M9_PORGN|nr:efflux RND transporter periplasmic adaptor subunit [Porphyromonas gingivalis]ATR90297.1 efflux RND transporter periplasmic adaptor subunit [Porphyromonas gingivalis]PDP76577.1 efflux transporter periplasmic adaptor subunit [Porphyromonas gingivalis]QUI89207.1 efflux RND transporter periplasmic adaptor subunit [Porphyromonas gingivalis]QUI91150.1 efflux RND transporter periplasmic adaptor subunit [Porphyromonas gingivalis]WCF99418.1 efflux RND transporter periplasmic adaptor subunit [Porphyr